MSEHYAGHRTDWQTLGLPEFGTAFNWRARPAAPAPKPSRQVANLTPEQIERRREYQRAYIKTDVGIANRNAARQRERLQAKATRVNKHNLLITHRTEADRDKSGALTGRSTPNGIDR